MNVGLLMMRQFNWDYIKFNNYEIIYEILAKKLFLKNSLFYDKALNEDIIRLYLR